MSLQGFLEREVSLPYLLHSQSLVRTMVRICHSLEKDILGRHGAVGKASADCAHGLLHEGIVLGFREILASIGDECDSETPDHLFLGCCIALDCKNVLAQVAGFCEYALVTGLVIEEQSEVGIVRDQYDLLAGIGMLLEDGCNGIGL